MRLVILAACLMFAVVGLGAFGAHGLKSLLQETGHQGAWETAVLYHSIHGMALLAVGVWQAVDCRAAGGPLRAVGWLWAVGIVGFSGSLYILSLGGPKWLGPITPLGGLCFLAGWIALAMAAWKLRKAPGPA